MEAMKAGKGDKIEVLLSKISTQIFSNCLFYYFTLNSFFLI